jgi:pre-mRNA-splicing factor SYF2
VKRECQKQKIAEAFYGGWNTILKGLQKDTKKGRDRMVQDLEKQVAKRMKYSRRRMHNDDADIDYKNERNMKFN